ncbi:MAG: hypothetical protein JNK27_02365 [Chitinophagaceae bacterium]|nr:hypothetical protein [Chitinophagaceae bacterium]
MNFSVKPNSWPNSFWLTILLLLSPLFFHAQSLTGLWVGSLHNDSSTVRKDQSFEIALTEYKGKVYGYSRSEFIVNDTLYYIMKRVKGTIEGDICEVTDDEVISYNFRGKLDKGIKVTSTFRRNKNDSTWYLDGTWKTNANRKYYSVSGKVKLEEEKDLTASKIFPHLEELKKADDVAFYKERKEGPPVVKIAKPERINTEPADKTIQSTDNKDIAAVVRQPDLPKTEPKIVPVQDAAADVADENKEQGIKNTATATDPSPVPVKKADEKKQDLATTETQKTKPGNDSNEALAKNSRQQSNTIKQQAISSAKEETVISNQTTAGKPATNTNRDVTADRPKQDIAQHKNENSNNRVNDQNKPVATVPQKTSTNQPVQKPATNTNVATNKPADNNKKPEAIATTAPAANTIAEKKETVATAINPVAKKPAEDVIKKSAVIEGRKSEFSQEVNFKSDSLVLSLYDNGEIDGDTVSVYMNGEVIMASQGLKSSAIRKTIYLPEGSEEFTLVMFAESLGKYPPNTGLLVIRDGTDVYNLRFSSDFQKSSGIVFRRKN